MTNENCIFRKVVDMKDVWEKPEASTDLVYVVFRGKKSNVTALFPGKIGREFHKTHGHYHLHGETESYRVLYGTGLLLIQKEPSNSGANIDFKAIELSCGDAFIVPEGYGHAIVNPTDDFFITEDKESPLAGHNYDPIKKMRGFAKYVVEEDGRVIFLDNVHYNKGNNQF